jgi:diguanylate cyclase (GGDEF)-like protein
LEVRARERENLSPMAHILLEDGKRREPLELAPDLPAKIGRALEGAVVLEDKAASREHCLVERTPEGWRLRDLGSRNGTRLNGRLLPKEPALLRAGDRIEIGQAVLTFAGEGDEGKATVSALETAARARERSTASLAALGQDHLTGLATFPLLLHELRTQLAPPGADETGVLHPVPVSLLLLDLDGLGLLNEIFGYRAGDEAIRIAGLELQAGIAASPGAATGLAAREGGGKFGVLVPGLDATQALAVAESVRARIAKRPLEGALREAQLTASLGVVSAPEDATSWRELVRRAEAALARAKREGRDRAARPPASGTSAAAGRPAPTATASGIFKFPAGGRPGEAELEPLLLKKEGRAALALVAQALGSDLELEPILAVVLEVLVDRTGARRGFVVLRDARTGELSLQASVDRDPQAGEAGPERGPSHGVLKEALAKNEAVLVEDALADARFKKRQSIVLKQPRSVLAVPITDEPGGAAALGVLYLDHRGEPGRFGREQRDLALAIARLLSGPVRRSFRSAETTGELARLRRVLERTRDAEARTGDEERGLLGASAAVKALHRAIDRAAANDLPVAVSGESGTGKELVARAIHAGSARARGPFVAENVAALPETLLEAELFGHARGAFTGAGDDRAGLFEAAHQGTLFLDEVGEMSPRLQAKLLRVLQEKEVRRLGEEAPRKIDVRLVTATNKDLDALAREGRFRQDLLYRIRVFTIEVPPLRARREDVPRLLSHFLEKAAPGRAPRVSKDALALLVHHDWPGNVRELENEARKLAALGAPEIGTRDLSPQIRRDQTGEPAGGTTARKIALEDGTRALLLACDGKKRSLTAVLESFEREAIARVLEEEHGNRTLTARRLGITRQGLHKKLKRYGMDS